MSGHRLTKIFAGRWAYRGRVLQRTTWEGPRGGLKERWEIGDIDPYGDLVLDGGWTYPTRAAAMAAVDEQAD